MNSIIIAMNIIKRQCRELLAFSFMFIFPVLAGILAVLMFGKTPVIDVGITNMGQNDYGFYNYFHKSEKYDIKIINENQIEEALKNKKIKIGVVFPKNFHISVDSNYFHKIKIISLKNEPEVNELRGQIEVFFSSTSQGIPLLFEKTVNNMEKFQQSKLAIGILAMFIIMSIGTCMGTMLEDKKKKTFMRSYCAPLKDYEIMLGYLMANVFIGFLQIILFLAISTSILNINWGTSVLNVFIILIMYLIASIGLVIGLLGFVKDNEKFSTVIPIIAIITSFLGGSFLPLENLNEVFNKISNFMPQKWLVDSFNKLIEGSNLIDIQINLWIMLLFGAVLFTFGVKMLKPSTEDL